MEPLAIVLASDGVWLYTSNNEVKDIVNNFAYSKDANKCAKRIVEKASENWNDISKKTRDDITCIVIYFKERSI